MKSTRLILFAMAAWLLGACTQSSAEITLSGVFIGDIPEEMKYTVPISGINFWGFANTIKPDSTGRFSITVHSHKPALIALYGWNNRKGHNSFDYLLVEPGNHYDLVIDLTAGKSLVTVNENHCPAQALVAEFPWYGHPESDELWHLTDSSTTAIRNTIQNRMDEEIASIALLSNKEHISAETAQMLSYTRRIYNLHVLQVVSSFKYLTPLFEGEESSDEAVLALWQEAISGVSAKDKYFFSAPHAYEFLRHSMWGRLYADEGFARAGEIQRDYIDRGLRHTRNLSVAASYLEPEALEYFNATYLFFHAWQKKYEKELMALYEQYRIEHPQSEYLTYLNPLMEGIAHFHEKAAEDTPEKIHIMENYASIRSFNELISSFAGQRVYIDVWATWCGPCKKEFEWNDELKTFLRQEGIQMLYISIDRESDDEQWRNMIKFYNLEGYHVRAGRELNNDVHSLLGIRSIPHFAYVNEQGQIAIPKAPRPSALTELARQIREYENL